jgi:chemotaxis protein methyltransferase CheR
MERGRAGSVEVQAGLPARAAPIGRLDLIGSAEAHISDCDFQLIRQLASAHAGIAIPEYKRHMVCRRLGKRLRSLRLPDVAAYCAYLRSDAPAGEIQELINALTTNKTEFFRESHHFDHLETHALPSVMSALQRDRSRRLRLWSAGCSSGEEPYSAAMVLHSGIPEISKWDARILATDIDTEIVDKARAANYDESEIAAIPPVFRKKYLEHVGNGKYRVCASARSLVTFSALNLHDEWPMRGPFDIVFCRNVVIYFDKINQCRLFDRFAEIMRLGAYLYVGHSESLYKVSNRFELVGQSIYKRIY